MGNLQARGQSKGIIRKAKISDIPEILNIERVSFADPWTYSIFRQEIELGRFYVYELEGKVVGYIGFTKVLDEVHITNVAVHPLYRRRGIASELMSRVISENPDCYFYLEVRVSNTPAIRLYEKFGFRKIAIRKRYYENEDAYLMVRPKRAKKR